MRRVILAVLLLVATALLCWALDRLGVTFKHITFVLVGVTLAGFSILFFTGPRLPDSPPWTCSSCGELEARFVRQCGKCEAYRVMPLTTDRLLLREWTDFDLEPFAAMNADPRVMEHFPAPLTREQSDALAGKIRAAFANQGFGLWAVEIPGVAPFIGFIGLAVPGFKAPFTPCVEIGWRLAFDHWGKGFATEGALKAIEFGFETARLREIVSFTSPLNKRSIRVMEKLGMTRDRKGDFEHPNVAPGHILRGHVLYRLSK